jgi:hypothetical protein
LSDLAFLGENFKQLVLIQDELTASDLFDFCESLADLLLKDKPQTFSGLRAKLNFLIKEKSIPVNLNPFFYKIIDHSLDNLPLEDSDRDSCLSLLSPEVCAEIKHQ